MSNLKIYPTLQDVYNNGLNDSIHLFRLQRSFNHYGTEFKENQLFYISDRSYAVNKLNKTSIPVYTYPDGNLYHFPCTLNGNFVKYSEENQQIITSETNESSLPTNTHQESTKASLTEITESPEPCLGELHGNQFEILDRQSDHSEDLSIYSKASNTDKKELCSSDSNETKANDNKTYHQKFKESSNDVDDVNDDDVAGVFSVTNTAKNQKKTTVLNSKVDGHSTNEHRKITIKNSYENTSINIKTKFSENGKNTVPDPIQNPPPKQITRRPIHHRQHGLNVKTLRTHSQDLDSTKANGSNTSHNPLKRPLSIFTDKEYVSMTSIEKFDHLMKSYTTNDGALMNSDVINEEDDQKDYLDMSHPTLSYQTLLNQARLARHHTLSEFGGSQNKLYTTQSTDNLTDHNKLHHFKNDSKHKSNGNGMTLYERLMIEITKDFDISKIRSYDQNTLSNELDFNRFESRLIFYSTRGWLPNELPSSLHWQHKFPDDLSVNELYNFMTNTLGNHKLADYLRNYSVDGYFMKLLIKDDLLLDGTLFDDSWITNEQLQIIREKYHPKRPRCYAVDMKTTVSAVV